MYVDLTLVFFIIVSLIVSIVDVNKEEIPDILMLPSIFILAVYKYYMGIFEIEIIYATGFIIFIFILPIALNMQFGGGDIRFGIFSAVFLSFPNIILFVLLSGILHLVFLLTVRKNRAGFAPAMSIAAVVCYLFHEEIWTFFDISARIV